MIKFFRKIRQKLLTENKFSKYLIYAIGEIILVVIGILIALNLNTANEKKNNSNKTNKILKEIQLDLEKDINRSIETFDDFIILDSIQELILTKKYTVEDFKTGKAQTLGQYYYDFVIHTNGYDNLMRNLDNLPDKYKPLLASLNNLYEIQKTKIEVYNTRIRKTVYDNLTFTNNQPWAQDWILGIPNKEAFDYYLNDPLYKGHLINYINDRTNISSVSNRYRIDAKKTYKEITKLLANNDTIPKVINLKNKDIIKENKLIGTYGIRDSLGRNMGKKIKVSKLKNQLYLGLDDSDKFKLNWHKKFIYFADDGFNIYNFNKLDTLIVRADINGNAIFVKENSNPQ
jgi:hypothetical protein